MVSWVASATTASDLIGSLLPEIYNEAGKLNYLGFTSGIKADVRAGLTRKLEKLVSSPGFRWRRPCGKSRWTSGSSRDWKLIRPELVVGTRYDHFAGGRFRQRLGLESRGPTRLLQGMRTEQAKRGRGCVRPAGRKARYRFVRNLAHPVSRRAAI
jgi:ATP-dependent DNA ligase